MLLLSVISIVFTFIQINSKRLSGNSFVYIYFLNDWHFHNEAIPSMNKHSFMQILTKQNFAMIS